MTARQSACHLIITDKLRAGDRDKMLSSIDSSKQVLSIKAKQTTPF